MSAGQRRSRPPSTATRPASSRAHRSRRPAAPAASEPAAPRGALPGASGGEPTLGWGAGLAVLAIALLVRLGVAAQLAGEPLSQAPQLDSLQLLTWARQIAAGNFLWPVPPPHGLGYPVLLAALLELAAGSLEGVRAVQALLGAAGCALVAAIAARGSGRAGGVLAGLLVALHGPLVWIDVSLLAEGTLLLLLSLALWVATAPRGLARGRPLFAGAVLGAGVLVRPTAAALLPGMLLGAWRRGAASGRRWAALALLALGWLLVVGPVVWRISRENGAFVPVQGHSGFAFHVANRPGGDGLPSLRHGRGWEQLETAALRAGIEDPAAQDRHYRNLTLRAMRERPLATLRRFAGKALWLLQAAEVRDSHSYEFFRSRSPLLRALPGMGLLLALAAAGALASAIARRPPPVEVTVGLALSAALLVVTMVGTRYRLPLVPLLAVLAAPLAPAAAAAVRAHRWQRLAALVGSASLVWLLAHARPYPPSHDFTEELTMTGAALEALGRPAEAAAAYRRSLALDGTYVPALEALARLHLVRGEAAAAEELLRRALRHDPEAHRAHLYLGALLQASGRAGEALAALRRAGELSPHDLPTLRRLAPQLLAAGELVEAADAYGRLARLDTADAEAQLALARLAGARGRPREGIDAARRAVELAPRRPDAWVVLARLAVDSGDVAVAEAALARAEGLAGGGHPLVVETRARLAALRARGGPPSGGG